MASLNNIFLVLLLFLNLFILFKPINCDCIHENYYCNNGNNCCSGLNCKTNTNGDYQCMHYGCGKRGARCDTGKIYLYCCAGFICSNNAKTCDTCLRKTIHVKLIISNAVVIWNVMMAYVLKEINLHQ